MALKQLFFLIFLYIFSTAILPLTCNASIYRVPPPPPPPAAAAPRGAVGRSSNARTATTADHNEAGELELLELEPEPERRLVPLKIGRLMAFNILPRGMPFPPSGPSKRHNSVNHSAVAVAAAAAAQRNLAP
ncbi:formin-like protein 3 isoform X1 [Iris pallida]|uniref:Formin-like protein 3 isoform X1 n=1 Tax=Iris pallida TaxID=29817 RepID=A0AAX6F9M7_IRIPA|nr:formin-like protein 3 isoform X1 [Iris pallida]